MNIDQILRNELTPEQYAAASDPAQEVLCLACAGSGKSRTLAYRIARLLAEGEPPEGVVALTFTENYVFAERSIFNEAERWLKENREKIIEPKVEPPPPNPLIRRP
jgi:hypothetical protein